jgi:hypothetical protein
MDNHYQHLLHVAMFDDPQNDATLVQLVKRMGLSNNGNVIAGPHMTAAMTKHLG